MKKVCNALTTIFFLMLASASLAHADLDTFLADLNIRARADIPGFSSSLSKRFNVPLPEVHVLLDTVEHPSDVFMFFQLSRMTGIHIEKVVETYRGKASGGWGVVAKELGIKPGSEAFHALKRGEFYFFGVSGGKTETKKYKNKGKSNGKGHKK